MSTTGFFPQGQALPKDWNDKPALSYSVAKVLATKTPAAAFAYHRMLGGEKKAPTDAQIRGIIFDDLILSEVANTRLVEIDADSFRTAAAKGKRDEALAAGKLPVLKAHLDEYREIVKTHLRPKLGPIFGQAKVRMAWLSGGDVVCHGEFDALNREGIRGEGVKVEGLDEGRPIVWDAKSCTCAIEASEDRKIYDFDYQIQHAAYTDALFELDPELGQAAQFVFVFYEVVPPYDVRFVQLERSFVEMGQGDWWRAVSTWRECMASGKWPGSPRKIHKVSAPPWAYRESQRKLAEKMHEAGAAEVGP